MTREFLLRRADGTRQSSVMLQRRMFHGALQHFCRRIQGSQSLLSGFSCPLRYEHRSTWHGSKPVRAHLPARRNFSSTPTSNLRNPARCGHEPGSGLPDVRERTLIAVKPDGVQRRLVGQIIQRFEQRGFKLVGLKMLKASEELLSEHYCELRPKPFYRSLLHYMTSGPVVVMVWEGHNVVQTSRIMVGHTNPAEAQAGTVRGDFSIHVSRNVVHASDSLEGAQREIQLWFQAKDLLDWDCCDQTSTSEF